MKEHIDRFVNLWHERDLSAPIDTPPLPLAQVNLAFLTSLGEPWRNYHMALADNAYTMPSGELFAQVDASAETSQAARPRPPDANALSTRFDTRNNGGRRNKKSGGNSRRFQPYPAAKSQQNGSSPPKTINGNCSYCKQPGHTRDDCFKLKWSEKQWLVGGKKGNNGKPNESRPAITNNSGDSAYDWRANVTQYTPSVNLVTRYSADNTEWVVDTASNTCLTPFKDRLERYDEFDNIGSVRGVGGKRVFAYGTGSVTMTDPNGNHYTVKDVLYVPQSSGSIISLMKVKKDGLGFRFLDDNDDGDFLLSSSSTNFELVGHAVDNILYVTEGSKTPQTLAVNTRSSNKRKIKDSQLGNDDTGTSAERSEPIKKRPVNQDLSASPTPDHAQKISCNPANLWYLKLIHASSSSLSKLKSIKSTFNTNDCIACIRAKHHKSPFPASDTKTTEKGQVVHTDVAGPFPVTKHGSKYILTFLDDFTHYCWVEALPNKNAVTVRDAISKWVKEFENKEVKLQHLRSDGGTEYRGDVVPLLESIGTTRQLTAPYTPQSNGKAERLNRTLVEAMRAMLFHANLPSSFWAEAISTAALTLNYLPSSAVDDKIPWELWHGKEFPESIFQNLHPFGSIVHAYIPRPRRWAKGKITSKSTGGCFMGYRLSDTHEPTGTFKYYDLERKVFDFDHNLKFTNEFPKHGDFDEPSAAPPVPATLQPPADAPTPVETPVAEPIPPEPRPIYDMIVVEPSPALQVFASYSSSPDGDPPTFADALRRPDSKEWLKSMEDEMQSIQDNDTWTLCDLPPGRKCIGTKWVFKTKRDGNNNFLRYKSRLVAKGYAQIPGIDYDRTFAPVVRIESIRCLLAVAAFEDLDIKHVDCKTAFLNGDSDLCIYVQQPEGFVSRRHPNKVLRLNKSLYGLKQAPRIWYLLLCNVIQSYGFEPLESDTSIYYSPSFNALIAVYVDDILIFSRSKSTSDEIFTLLRKHFSMQDLGYPQTFLGLNVVRNDDATITINQAGYIDRMLERFDMTNAVSAKTPLDPSLPLLKAKDSDKRANVLLYQELVGSLNHLAVFSRPDISNAVSQLSQFLQDPTETHLKAARHVLRYLKGSCKLSITYGGAQNLLIIGFTDADWGGDKNDRKSTTGYVYMVNNGAVSWSSRKQTTVAVSTTEAEYMAISDAAREALARSQLYGEFLNRLPAPLILSDNQGALDISENPTNYQRAKHIDIRYHFVRHVLHSDQIALDYVPTTQNPADILTKALQPVIHQRCIGLLNLR
jgi:hypothetical protein